MRLVRTLKILFYQFLFIFSVFFAITANAKLDTKNKAKAQPKIVKETEAEYFALVKKLAPVIPSMTEFPYINEQQQAKIKDAIENQRYPANTDGAVGSAEYVKLSDEFVNISSAAAAPLNNLTLNTDRLDAFLEKLENNYQNFQSPDTQLFASQLIPLRYMRGIVWKMIGLFDDSKDHPAHYLSLSFFKGFANDLRIFSPDENWRLGFDYLTQPYMRRGPNGNQVVSEKFKSVAEFQGLIGGALYNAVEQASTRLAAINVQDPRQPILWNQRIVFGPNSFKDDAGQFKRIGELEKQMMLSNTYYSLSQMAAQRAFSMQGALNLIYDYGKLYGLSDFIFGKKVIEGVTAEDQHKIFKKQPRVGVAFTDGTAKMGDALTNLRNAVLALKMVWIQAKKDRPGGQLWAFNTSFLRLDTQYGDQKINELAMALEGPVTIRNKISGETADVNLAAFYLNPPRQLSDLMAKEPFEKGYNGEEWVPLNLTSSTGQTYALEYRDYFKGGAKNWDPTKFQTLFPGVKSSEDVKRSLRVLASSFGSFVTIGPFQPPN